MNTEPNKPRPLNTPSAEKPIEQKRTDPPAAWMHHSDKIAPHDFSTKADKASKEAAE